ncbi:MAG: DUF2110 family protein [Thermococci archaeon]|nr:DUF2110 family protein [Thermococci archaeon]
MGSSVIIPEKVYGDRSGFSKLQRMMGVLLGDLHVEWRLSVVDKQWVKVSVEGEDEEIATSLIRKEFGQIPVRLSSIREGEVLRGRLIDVGKVGYGIYVDVGVLSPRPKDALVPLYWLKKTFWEAPLRAIADGMGWVDGLPVEVEITRVEFGTREIEAVFSDDQLAKFREWRSDGLDKLLIAGTIQENVEKALLETGHHRDVRRIEELGLMETLVVLKKGTDAPGIIKEIGPLIRSAAIGSIRPGSDG